MIYTSSANVILPPGEFHPFAISIDLTDAEYVEASLSILIKITVYFTDIMNREQNQTIAGSVTVNRELDEANFYPMTWMFQQNED